MRFTILFLFFSSWLHGQIDQSPAMLVSSLSVISSSAPNYVVQGSFSSQFGYTRDSIVEGTDVMWLNYTVSNPDRPIRAIIDSFTVISGNTLRFYVELLDGETVLAFPTGTASIYRPTTNYDLILEEPNESTTTKAQKHNANMLAIDAALSAGSTDSTIYATVYRIDTASQAIRNEIAALPAAPSSFAVVSSANNRLGLAVLPGTGTNPDTLGISRSGFLPGQALNPTDEFFGYDAASSTNALFTAQNIIDLGQDSTTARNGIHVDAAKKIVLGGTYMLNHPSEFSSGRYLNWGAFQTTIGSDADSTGFTIDNINKRIGIGQRNPNAKLRIKGNGNTSSTFNFWAGNSDSTSYMRFRDDGALLLNTQSLNYLFVQSNGRLTFGGNNGTPGSGSIIMGLSATGTGAGQVVIGQENTAGSGSDVSLIGRYVQVSGTRSNIGLFGNYIQTNVSTAGFLGIGRSASALMTQAETGSFGIGVNAGVPTFQVRGFDTTAGLSWSSSNDTITTTVSHGLLKNQGIGLVDAGGTLFQYRTITSIVSGTKFVVNTVPTGFTTGSSIAYNSATMAYIDNAALIATKFWQVSNIGQVRQPFLGTGEFTGTIAFMNAVESDGDVFTPTKAQVKTYLGVGGGTDRAITTDQSYTATDLGNRVKISDTGDDSNFITYTLPASPAEGDLIYFRNTSTVNDANDGAQINGNGKNIMGAATYEFTGTGTIILRYSADGTEWEIY